MSNEDLTPIVDFLARHPPFQQMDTADREFLARHATLAFFSTGEVILSEEQGDAKQFFILKQGRVRRETRNGEVLPEGAWELVTGECFPIGALLSRRPVHTAQRAVEDTFAYVIPRDRFEELYQRSAVFHDFCSSRLANLLDHALRTAQGNKANQAAGDASLSTPLSALIRRAPIHSSPDTPMEQVLQFMQDERVGSVVATDGEGRPLGIFTLHDLLSRVALPELSLSAKLSDAMTLRPFALSHSALARDAAMVMAEKGFAHICVTDDQGKLIGVLSERDLFSLQRVGLVNLARAIPKAASIKELADLGRDVHQLIDQMLAQGASVAQLTQITALLNDHITRRVIDLTLAEAGHPGFPFTWLAFGSEGRGEQTLRTGQDNGILFVPPQGLTAGQMREALLPLALRINQGLEATGFPLGEGKVIAAKAECCLSLSEWRERFALWIDQGSPEELLAACPFFDLRPIWGEEEAARELMNWVVEHGRQDARFLRQMAVNALRNKPPLGLMRDFVTEGGDSDHPDCLDLKVTGTIPFVDGARVLAIANGIARTNTLERFRALIERAAATAEDVDAWCDAYGFIQLLRMRLHQAQEQNGKPLANYQNPDDLNELDRRILKESFRQERKLQSKLSQEYRA